MTDRIDDNIFGDSIKEEPEKKGAAKVASLNKTGKTVTTSSLVRENIRIKKSMALMAHDLHVLRSNNDILNKSINELKQENKHRLKEIEVLRSSVLKMAQAIDALTIRLEQGKSKK